MLISASNAYISAITEDRVWFNAAYTYNYFFIRDALNGSNRLSGVPTR